MPIPGRTCRIVLRGVMPGGEIFETGFWMSDTGVTDEATANALALIIAGTLNSSDASGAMRISASILWKASISWTEVRVYAYMGGTSAAAIGSSVLSPARGGTSSGAVLSNQTSMCISLRTGFSGRRNRGRMYLPVNGLALDLEGQWTVAQLQPIVDAWALAFTDINASDAGKIVVVSQVNGSYHPVTQLILDTRPDVVRRRANQQNINGRATKPVGP